MFGVTDARPQTGTAPPGWYPDPWAPGSSRYWDGATWTASVEPGVPPAVPSWSSSPWTTPGAPVEVASPPRGASRRFPIIGVLAIVVIVAFVGGIGVAVVRSGHRSTSTSAAPALSPDQKILHSLVVTPADVPSGLTVDTIPGGDDAQNEATLNICNATFPSEQLRVARHQVAAGASQGGVVFSTEAVVYRNPAATAQAFTELREAAAHCPTTPVPSPIGGQTQTTVFNPAPDGSWAKTPPVERLAFDMVSTDDQGNAQHSIVVYLRRGRVLEGVYFYLPQSQGLTVAGQSAIPDIVKEFASRIAALPTSVVNANVTKSI